MKIKSIEFLSTVYIDEYEKRKAIKDFDEKKRKNDDIEGEIKKEKMFP